MRLRLSGLALLLLTIPASAAERFTGPWKMAELKRTPTSEVSRPVPGSKISEVFYENVPFAGKPTRVFAYYAVPEQGQGPFPAMVLVHGGGGKAFREWASSGRIAAMWPSRWIFPGRARTASDSPTAVPSRTMREVPRIRPHDADQMWTYHAVAAGVRAPLVPGLQPEVDKDRIGMTGICWGGYLTCIVAGIDDRVKVAVPVYGCGFLDENSDWVDPLQEDGARPGPSVGEPFDPSRYLPGVTCPILFVNGTNDFAYPLDSYQKSYQLVKVPTDLCVTVRMPHGHPAGMETAGDRPLRR